MLKGDGSPMKPFEKTDNIYGTLEYNRDLVSMEASLDAKAASSLIASSTRATKKSIKKKQFKISRKSPPLFVQNLINNRVCFRKIILFLKETDQTTLQLVNYDFYENLIPVSV
jgi:hypothetical protein